VSDTTVTLRLQADNRGLLPPLKQAQAAVDEVGKAAGASGRAGAAGLSNIGHAASRAERDVGRLNQTAKLAAGSIAALASISTIKQLAGSFLQAADRAGQLSARMQLATQSHQEYNTVMERSKQIAHRSYQSIGQVAEIAIQAADPMRQLGYSIKDTMDLTEALSLSLVVSGANQQRAANAITQFSQAMQTGTLRGQEFRTVLENAPRFVTALEQSLGKTRAELIAMARDGELTVDALSGVTSQLAALREETEAMPTTLEDARARFGNAWQEFAEGASKAVNANQALVKIIEVTADNLGNIALAAGVVTLAVGGRLVGALVQATQKKLADIAASRAAAQAELQAARAAQAAAAGRLSAVRAGIGGTLSLAAAETQLAAAQARTTAATVAASNALRTKAAAVNLARGALAMFGGPVGLAVTALTAFVLWVRNSRAEAEQLAESVKTHFQSAMGTFREFNEETANTAFSGLASANKELADAEQHRANALRAVRVQEEANMRAIARHGYVYQSQIDALAERKNALEQARITWQHLAVEEHRVIKLSAELVQQAAGITNATEAETTALREKLRELSNLNQTLDEVKPLLAEYYNSAGDAASANALLAASFANIAQSIKRVDWGEIDKSLAQHIQSAELRQIELTQGKLARTRLELEGLLPTGDNIDRAEMAQRKAQIDAIIEAEEANNRLAESVRRAAQAEQEVKRAAEELTRQREQQAQSQAKYADEAALVAAQLTGPIAEAETQRIQRIKALDAELASLNITQADHTVLVNAARTAEAKRVAELHSQQSAPRALLDTMTGELQLLANTREQREILTRQLHAEHEMREAITQAIEAGNAALRDSPDEQEKLIQHARALAASSVEIERNTERVREWADVATRGVAGIADVFTDVATRTIRTSRDMFSALKDVWKRGFADLIRTALEQDFVRPIQQTLLGMLSGQGYAAAGQASGNYAQALAKGVSGQVAGQVSGGIISGVAQRVRGFFGGSAAKAATGSTAATGLRQMAEINGQLVPVMTDQAGSVIGMGQAAMGVGLAQRGGLLTRGFANGIPYAGAALGLGGLYYGLSHVGNGGLSSALGGLSYGALGLGLGGLLSGGAAALASGASLTGGAMAGMSGAFGALGSAAWLPVAGQIAAAAALINSITGGGLLGTKWQAKQGNTTLNIGAAGGSASAQIYEERKKSFYRGTARRWSNVDASDEARNAARELYTAIDAMARTSAQQLGIEMAARVTGAFKTTFDRNGNVTGELSTVLGRTYKENIEAFQQRLSAETIIAQVGKIDGTAFAVAERWRANAEQLLDGAQYMLTAATDVANGLDMWSQHGLSALTKVVERMQIGDETLTKTYQRITATAAQYGQHIAGIETDLRTRGLNAFQRAALDVERQYRDHVRTANDLAKALGLSGARADDLAKIEQWRAVNMAEVQRQLESERNRLQDDLRLSQYSPLTDKQKLSDAMSQLSSAVAAGDIQQARALSQSALELGRNLYASGRDYNALYTHVNGLLDTLGDGLDLDMDDGTTMGDLADILVNLPNNIAKSLFEQLYAPPAPPVVPASGGQLFNGEASQTLKDIESLLRDIRNSGYEAQQQQVMEALR